MAPPLPNANVPYSQLKSSIDALTEIIKKNMEYQQARDKKADEAKVAEGLEKTREFSQREVLSQQVRAAQPVLAEQPIIAKPYTTAYQEAVADYSNVGFNPLKARYMALQDTMPGGQVNMSRNAAVNQARRTGAAEGSLISVGGSGAGVGGTGGAGAGGTGGGGGSGDIGGPGGGLGGGDDGMQPPQTTADVLFPGDTPQGEQQQAITMALLGEHGGPAFLRNIYLESYGLNRQLVWAQQAASAAANAQGGVLGNIVSLTGTQGAAQAVSGAAAIAAEHPWMSYGVYKGIQTLGTIGGSLSHLRDFGGQLGLGTGTNAYIGGFSNPTDINQATRVGIGAEALIQALQGRSFGVFGGGGGVEGLSGQQARADVEEIAAQGFGANESATGNAGDLTTIAQQFFRPLQMGNNQLTAATLGQFVPALRNDNTSIDQLVASLSNLGSEAQSAKEPIDTFASSVATAAASFQSMGGSMQQGINLATGFTNITGLDPQVASTLAQNPMVQGMILGQYGVLPSGIPNMNAGAFSNASEAVLQMLQRGLSGLARPVYRDIQGHEVQVGGGEAAVYNQISSMTGIPEAVVQRMLGDQRGEAANARIESLLGNKSGNEQGTLWQLIQEGKARGGGEGDMTPIERKQAQGLWNTIAQDWQGTGLTKKEMERIGQMKSYAARANAVVNDMNKANQNNQWNNINGSGSGQTLGLTPQAAKLVQILPSVGKRAANAGQGTIGSLTNSVTGDLSGLAQLGSSALQYLPAGG